MSWLGRLFPVSASSGIARDPSDDFWYSQAPRKSAAAGVPVSMARARQVPVVRDCLKVLSDSVAGLSWRIVERRGDRSTTRRDDHPLAGLFDDPNPEQTSFDFFAQMVDDLAAHGNFYAEIVPGRRGLVDQLWRIEPKHVSIERTSPRERRFRIREPGTPERVLLPGEVWHIPVPPLVDTMRGTSAIFDDGREAIAAAIALQDYANSFFVNDATPPFLFKMAGKFDSEDSKRNFIGAWKKWFAGRNRHTPGVVEYGMDVEKVGVTNEEAQFLETRKELWLDITRLWRVPPHKVGILDRATFSNIEQQSLEFVMDTLRPWLELIERRVRKDLMVRPDRFLFEFNVNSLLRGDIKSRFDAYAVGRQWGWLSVNEIRKLERMNPIGAGGDRYVEPLNMTPVGTGRSPNEQPRDGTQRAVAFLRESVERNGGRPKLEVVSDAA